MQNENLLKYEYNVPVNIFYDGRIGCCKNFLTTIYFIFSGELSASPEVVVECCAVVMVVREVAFLQVQLCKPGCVPLELQVSVARILRHLELQLLSPQVQIGLYAQVGSTEHGHPAPLHQQSRVVHHRHEGGRSADFQHSVGVELTVSDPQPHLAILVTLMAEQHSEVVQVVLCKLEHRHLRKTPT